MPPQNCRAGYATATSPCLRAGSVQYIPDDDIINIAYINGACCNNFFTSLTKDFSSGAPKWLEDNKEEQLPRISNESVAVELSKLKIKKAPGLNNPNIKLLKTFATSFAVPLADIFNKSFEQKQFPTAWKKFLVVPIPKSVPCTSVEDVRPIALLSAISKIQESYAARWMNEDIGGKISEMQFGGQPGSSAVLALLHLVHKWHLALLNPGTVIRLNFCRLSEGV